MQSTRKLDGEYFSPTEMFLQAAKTFVDPLLYKAIVWLADDTAHTTMNEQGITEQRCVSCHLNI